MIEWLLRCIQATCELSKVVQLQDEILCVLDELMTDADIRPSLEAAVANLLKEEHKARTCGDLGQSQKQVCLDMLSLPDNWLRFLLSTIFLGRSMTCIELPQSAEPDEETFDQALKASIRAQHVSLAYVLRSLIRPKLVEKEEGAVHAEVYTMRLALLTAKAHRRCMHAFRIDRANARLERSEQLVECLRAWMDQDPTLEMDQAIRLRTVNQMNHLLNSPCHDYTSLPMLDESLIGKRVTFNCASNPNLQSLQGTVVAMDVWLGVYLVQLESGDTLVTTPEAVTLPGGFSRLLVNVAAVGLVVGIIFAIRRFHK
jgi:hypothetical protein